MKQRGKQDLLIHSQEMRELQRKLDHDSKLHEFLGVKGQKRIMADLEAKEALRKRMKNLPKFRITLFFLIRTRKRSFGSADPKISVDFGANPGTVRRTRRGSFISAVPKTRRREFCFIQLRQRT